MNWKFLVDHFGCCSQKSGSLSVWQPVRLVARPSGSPSVWQPLRVVTFNRDKSSEFYNFQPINSKNWLEQKLIKFIQKFIQISNYTLTSKQRINSQFQVIQIIIRSLFFPSFIKICSLVSDLSTFKSATKCTCGVRNPQN